MPPKISFSLFIWAGFCPGPVAQPERGYPRLGFSTHLETWARFIHFPFLDFRRPFQTSHANANSCSANTTLRLYRNDRTTRCTRVPGWGFGNSGFIFNLQLLTVAVLTYTGATISWRRGCCCSYIISYLFLSVCARNRSLTKRRKIGGQKKNGHYVKNCGLCQNGNCAKTFNFAHYGTQIVMERK